MARSDQIVPVSRHRRTGATAAPERACGAGPTARRLPAVGGKAPACRELPCASVQPSLASSPRARPRRRRGGPSTGGRGPVERGPEVLSQGRFQDKHRRRGAKGLFPAPVKRHPRRPWFHVHRGSRRRNGRLWGSPGPRPPVGDRGGLPIRSLAARCAVAGLCCLPRIRTWNPRCQKPVQLPVVLAGTAHRVGEDFNVGSGCAHSQAPVSVLGRG